LDWNVGLGVALPLAALDQYDRHGRVAYGKAAALFGLRDIWLWAPNRLGIAVPAKATILRNWYRLGADCAISVLVPTRDTLGSGTDFIGQARFTASVIKPFFEVGSYVQAVGFATSSNEHLQLAIAPFLRVNSGKIGVGIESLIPLDAPLANQNRWSLHFMFQIRGNNE
jgi:hypothetical protein